MTFTITIIVLGVVLSIKWHGKGKKQFVYKHQNQRGHNVIAAKSQAYIYLAGCYSLKIMKISPDGENHDIVLGRTDGISFPAKLCYNELGQWPKVNDIKQLTIWVLKFIIDNTLSINYLSYMGNVCFESRN